LEAKTTKHYEKMLEAKRNIQEKDQKPLYKLKMFKGVGSIVMEGIKNFKTYNNKHLEYSDKNNKNNLDCIIEKIQNELNEMQENQNGMEVDNS